jgi:methionine-rich copper-binding protein CopC
MNSFLNTHRRVNRARRPRVDWLEPRRLLSTGPDGGESFPLEPGSGPPADVKSDQWDSLNVVAVDPAPNAILETSPERLTLTFNQPLSLAELGPWSVALYRLVDGEPAESVFDVAQPDSVGTDQSATQLIVTLSEPLEPGAYRIVIPGGVGLRSHEGLELLNPDEDHAVGDFTVEVPQRLGTTLDDAEDLGVLGPKVVSVSGVLDFDNNPFAVRLYRVSTPPDGLVWRLGAEIRIPGESTLDTALSLFDDQGRPLAAADHGRSDAPENPYLFFGLEPARTYYLGVSGGGNLAGRDGGYDLVAGRPGVVPHPGPAGEFLLDLVLDPADEPVRLIDFRLDHADPLDPAPSGFTVQFSGAIQSNFRVDEQTAALLGSLELEHEAGVLHRLTAIAYQESQARVSFLFPTRLAPGVYTVRVPKQGGLADLIGRSPVADGLPPGVLAQFTIDPDMTDPRDPHDWGVIFPTGPVIAEPLFLELQPGEPAVTSRFVIPSPGLYRLAIQTQGAGLGLELVGPDATRPLDPGNSGAINLVPVIVTTPGVHLLRMSATGAEPVSVSLRMEPPTVAADSEIRAGIGQGPALSLRLIAPTPPPEVETPTNSGESSASPPPITPPSIPQVDPDPSGLFPDPPLGSTEPAAPFGPEPFGGSQANAATSSAPGGPSAAQPGGTTASGGASSGRSLPLSLGGELVGRPNPLATHVTAVGPSVGESSPALAVNQRLDESSPYQFSPWGALVETDPIPGSGMAPLGVDGAMVFGSSRGTPGAEESPSLDTEWMDRLIEDLARSFVTAPDPDQPLDEAITAVIPETGQPESEPLLEPGREHPQVSLAEPLSVTVLIALLTRKKLRGQGGASDRRAASASALPTPNGPRRHARSRPHRHV